MNQVQNRLFRMATATFTAVCFSLTNFAVAAPVFSTSTPEVSFSPAIKLDQAIALRVPSSVATIEKLQSGSGKTIFHIQTAHGHYQAQQQINLLLKDLEKNYGVKTVLLEGASESLNAEIINFFPEDHDRTMKVVDTLTRKAVLKGADIYLLESKEAKGLGIEDRAAYDRNLLDFTSVIRAREGSAQFLNQLEAGIEHVATVHLSGDLRTFLKRIDLRETGEIPFDVYLAQLKAAAQKYLDVNLSDASMQVLWPQLVRVFKIAEIEKRIDSATFTKEKDAFLKAIQPYAGNMTGEVQRMLELKDLSAHLPNPETAQLFQSLVEKLPANFDYGRFASVTAFCGILILKSEINATDLPVEITKLEDGIADHLAEKNTAKELVSILKDYRLLKKLFAMELVPGDFDKITSTNSQTTSPEFLPSAIVARLAKLNGDKRSKSIQFENTDKLDALYNRAIRFYEGARVRDQKMLARIEERLQSTGADKVAVITGGFHSEPFAKYFEQRGYNYALMTPKITTVDKEGHNSYLDIMMQFAKESSHIAQSSSGQSDSSTIESPDVLQTATETFSPGASLTQNITAYIDSGSALPAIQHVTSFSANSSSTTSATTLNLGGVSATVTGTVTRNAAVPAVEENANRSEARLTEQNLAAALTAFASQENQFARVFQKGSNGLPFDLIRLVVSPDGDRAEVIFEMPYMASTQDPRRTKSFATEVYSQSEEAINAFIAFIRLQKDWGDQFSYQIQDGGERSNDGILDILAQREGKERRADYASSKHFQRSITITARSEARIHPLQIVGAVVGFGGAAALFYTGFPVIAVAAAVLGVLSLFAQRLAVWLAYFLDQREIEQIAALKNSAQTELAGDRKEGPALKQLIKLSQETNGEKAVVVVPSLRAQRAVQALFDLQQYKDVLRFMDRFAPPASNPRLMRLSTLRFAESDNEKWKQAQVFLDAYVEMRKEGQHKSSDVTFEEYVAGWIVQAVNEKMSGKENHVVDAVIDQKTHAVPNTYLSQLQKSMVAAREKLGRLYARSEARQYTYADFKGAVIEAIRSKLTDGYQSVRFELDSQQVGGAVEMTTFKNLDRQTSLIVNSIIKIWKEISGRDDFEGSISVDISASSQDNQVVVSVNRSEMRTDGSVEQALGLTAKYKVLVKPGISAEANALLNQLGALIDRLDGMDQMEARDLVWGIGKLVAQKKQPSKDQIERLEKRVDAVHQTAHANKGLETDLKASIEWLRSFGRPIDELFMSLPDQTAQAVDRKLETHRKEAGLDGWASATLELYSEPGKKPVRVSLSGINHTAAFLEATNYPDVETMLRLINQDGRFMAFKVVARSESRLTPALIMASMLAMGLPTDAADAKSPVKTYRAIADEQARVLAGKTNLIHAIPSDVIDVHPENRSGTVTSPYQDNAGRSYREFPVGHGAWVGIQMKKPVEIKASQDSQYVLFEFVVPPLAGNFAGLKEANGLWGQLSLEVKSGDRQVFGQALRLSGPGVRYKKVYKFPDRERKNDGYESWQVIIPVSQINSTTFDYLGFHTVSNSLAITPVKLYTLDGSEADKIATSFRSEARGFQIVTYAQLRDKAFRDVVRPILEANQDKQFSLQFEMNGTKLGAATQGKVEYKTFASVETVQQQGLFKIWEIASGKSQDFSGNIEIALEARQQDDVIIVSAFTREFLGEGRILLGKNFIMNDQAENGWLPTRQDDTYRHRSLNSAEGLSKHNATVSLVTLGDLELVEGSFEVTLNLGHEGEQGGSIAKIQWNQKTDVLSVNGKSYQLPDGIRPLLSYDIANNTIEINFGQNLPKELEGKTYQEQSMSPSNIKVAFIARSEARIQNIDDDDVMKVIGKNKSYFIPGNVRLGKSDITASRVFLGRAAKLLKSANKLRKTSNVFVVFLDARGHVEKVFRSLAGGEEERDMEKMISSVGIENIGRVELRKIPISQKTSFEYSGNRGRQVDFAMTATGKRIELEGLRETIQDSTYPVRFYYIKEYGNIAVLKKVTYTSQPSISYWFFDPLTGKRLDFGFSDPPRGFSEPKDIGNGTIVFNTYYQGLSTLVIVDSKNRKVVQSYEHEDATRGYYTYPKYGSKQAQVTRGGSTYQIDLKKREIISRSEARFEKIEGDRASEIADDGVYPYYSSRNGNEASDTANALVGMNSLRAENDIYVVIRGEDDRLLGVFKSTQGGSEQADVKAMFAEIGDDQIRKTTLKKVARSEARATQLPKGRKDKIAFGTSGHRAEDISEEEAVKFALGVLNAYQKGSFEGAVQIGFDARLHGSEYAQVVATVLAQNGLEVEITKTDEIVTTPVMMERTRLEAGQKNRLAIHVTASHNPVKGKNGYWNGFKVLHNGAPSGGQSKERNQVVSWITEGANAETNKIEAVDLEQFDGFIDSGKIRWIEGANEASNARLRQTFQFDALKDALAKAGVKVVFSAMNGASAKQAPAVLNELGVLQSAHDLNPISERAGKGDAFTVKDDAGNERFFGPDPTKDYNWSADVKAAVEKMTSGATDAPDYVFMIDGDGDRLVIIDKTGKAVDPNALGMIFYHYLRKNGITTGQMVRTLPTTRGLDLLAKMFGDEILVTAVGSKNFAEAQNELVVGVEESGHVFFRYGNEEFNDSAIAEAVLALKVIADSGKTLGEYYDGVWTEVTEKTGVPRLRHHRTEVEPKKVDEALKNKVLMIRASKSFREEFATELQKRFDAEFGADTFGKWTNVDVTDSSGFAVEFEKGFAMPRNSGTEPVIREYEEFAVTLGDEGFKKAADIMQELLLEFNTARLSAEQEAALAEVAKHYTGKRAYIVKYVRMAMLYAMQASDPNFTEVDSKYVADQNHTGEGFSKTEFKEIENVEELIELAKASHVQVMSLDGGLGEKLRRADWKAWLIEQGALDIKAVKMDENGKPGLGAKGTDMGYLVTLPGTDKPYYLSVSESKLVNLYYQGLQHRFEGLSFEAIVNGDSIKSYEALFDKPNLIGLMNKEEHPKTYRELLKSVGVEIDDFFFQDKVPGLRYEGGVLPMPSLIADHDASGKSQEAYAQEAGHGQIGVATVINPEDYQPRADGKPDFFAFTNGDGQVSSDVSPEIIGDMIKHNRAIGNLVTPATRVDRKGGKYIVKMLSYFGVTKWLPGQRELAAAKEMKAKNSKAEQEFYDAGQPVGEARFGKGSAGKQPFNTNTFYGNRARLMPFLADLKRVMGEDAYLALVISPNFMKKDAKKGKDGKEYFPIDAAIGNVYHNINEFVLRMNMVAQAAAEGKVQLSDSQKRILEVIQNHRMSEVIHYYNVPRRMFTPQKNPLDAVIQMVGGFFKYDLNETGKLKQADDKYVPAEFDIKDAQGNAQDSGKGYYSEFLNMLRTFVDTTSIATIQKTKFNVTKLDELKIQGNLSIKETVFEGDVELINESKSEEVFDLRAAILASNELKAIVGYQEGQPLTLRNIRLTISEKGVVRAELLRVEDVVIQRGANHIRLVRETASSEATAMLNYLEARLGGESTFSRNGAAVRVALNVLREQKKIEFVFDSVGNLIAVQPRVVVGGNSAVVVIDTSVERKEFEPVNGSLAKPVSGVGYVEIREALGIHMPLIADFSKENPTIQFAPAARSEAREVKLDIAEPAKLVEIPGADSVQVVTIKKDPMAGFESLKTFLNENMPKQSDLPLAYADMLAHAEKIEVYYIPGGSGAGAGIGRVVWMAGKNTTGDTVARLQIESSDRGIDEALPLHLNYKDEALAFVQGVNLQVQLGMPQANQITLALAVRSEARYTAATNPMNIDDVKNALGRLGLDYGQDHYLISQGPDYNGFAIDLKTAAPKKASPIANELKTESALLSQYPHLRVDVVDLNRLLVSVVLGGSPSTGGTSPRSGGGQFPTTTGDKDNPRVSPDLQVPSPIELLVANRQEGVESAGEVTTFTFSNEPAAQADSEETVIPAARLIEYLLKGLLSAGKPEANELRLALINRFNLDQPQSAWKLEPLEIVVDKDNNIIGVEIPNILNASAERVISLPGVDKLGARFVVSEPAVNIVKLQTVKARSEFRRFELVSDHAETRTVSGSGVGQRSYQILNTTIGQILNSAPHSLNTDLSGLLAGKASLVPTGDQGLPAETPVQIAFKQDGDGRTGIILGVKVLSANPIVPILIRGRVGEKGLYDAEFDALAADFTGISASALQSNVAWIRNRVFSGQLTDGTLSFTPLNDISDLPASAILPPRAEQKYQFSGTPDVSADRKQFTLRINAKSELAGKSNRAQLNYLGAAFQAAFSDEAALWFETAIRESKDFDVVVNLATPLEQFGTRVTSLTFIDSNKREKHVDVSAWDLQLETEGRSIVRIIAPEIKAARSEQRMLTADVSSTAVATPSLRQTETLLDHFTDHLMPLYVVRDIVKALGVEGLRDQYKEITGLDLAVTDAEITAAVNAIDDLIARGADARTLSLSQAVAKNVGRVNQAASTDDLGYTAFTPTDILSYAQSSPVAFVSDLEIANVQLDNRAGVVVPVTSEAEKEQVISGLLSAINSKSVVATRKLSRVELLKRIHFTVGAEQWTEFVGKNVNAIAWMNVSGSRNVDLMAQTGILEFNFGSKALRPATKMYAVGFLGAGARRAMAATRNLTTTAEAAAVLLQALNQQNAGLKWDGKQFTVSNLVALIQAMVSAQYIGTMA